VAVHPCVQLTQYGHAVVYRNAPFGKNTLSSIISIALFAKHSQGNSTTQVLGFPPQISMPITNVGNMMVRTRPPTGRAGLFNLWALLRIMHSRVAACLSPLGGPSTTQSSRHPARDVPSTHRASRATKVYHASKKTGTWCRAVGPGQAQRAPQQTSYQ